MLAPWYRPENHPHYKSPPVIETAIALEYGPVAGLDLYRLMRLQDRWAAEYPRVSDVPGAPPTPVDELTQEMFFIGEPPKRIWAAAADNGLLVQTQSDRLILNWRKPETVDPYPGYEVTRPEFIRLWSLLQAFLQDSGLATPIPTMAEFTYVNSVELDEGETPEDVLVMLREPESPLPGRERKARFQFIRAIEPSEADPYTAQVHVTGETQPTADASRQRLLFTVVARVLLNAENDAPAGAVDAAHGLATYTFSKIVSPTKQAKWNGV